MNRDHVNLENFTRFMDLIKWSLKDDTDFYTFDWDYSIEGYEFWDVVWKEDTYKL